MTDLTKLAADFSADAQRTYTTQESRAALRCALGDAATLCDAMAKNIEQSNPGRRKGSVSSVGIELADVARRLGDAIWAMGETVVVPPQAPQDAAPTPARTMDTPEPLGGVYGPLWGRDGGGAK